MYSTFAVAHLLEGRLVPEGVLARLDDEGETSGYGLSRFCCLRLLGGRHLVFEFFGSE